MKNGFTLAEVLITLAVIGVVSALVIPSVLKNYNDKKYNTARLKALKTFGEAGKMASINGEINGQPTARAFVENVLSKYLKITKICDTAEDCNFPTTFKASKSSTIKTSNNLKKWNQTGRNITTNNVAIDEANLGVFITTVDNFSAILHYNPKCARNSTEISFGSCQDKYCQSYAVDEACINVVYDMNGKHAPNHIGEDMGFVTVFWSGLNTIAVAPGILLYDKAKAIYAEGVKMFSDAQKLCTDYSYNLPNIYELQSIIINYNISSLPYQWFWSGSIAVDKRGSIWYGHPDGGRYFGYQNSGFNHGVWCVRR